MTWMWALVGIGAWLVTIALILAVVHVSQRKHWPPGGGPGSKEQR
jgi:hypothetical protein